MELFRRVNLNNALVTKSAQCKEWVPTWTKSPDTILCRCNLARALLIIGRNKIRAGDDGSFGSRAEIECSNL